MTISFGTDGVRGVANVDLTPEDAFALGRAGSFVLARQESGVRPRIMVGKDTRLSGDMLEAALAAGICSTGADVLTLGVIPTPAVAWLVSKYKASCGVVISASHNPVEDNGIKFFGPDGFKLPDDIEAEIERTVNEALEIPRPQGVDVGRVYDVPEALNNYVNHVASLYGLQQDLSALTVAVDCANGAAYQAGPLLLQQLGARVICINDAPNGANINERCGSTHPESLKKAVLQYRADLGIAYDGDADRCIAIDERGEEVDGDRIMVICGLDLKRRGELGPAGVVATVMSNIGLDIAFRRENVAVQSCKVGDRYVLEKMQQSGAILGGEQSGHIIFLQHATCGDGLLTSMKVMEAMVRSGLPLSVLAQEMERFPQQLVNLRSTRPAAVLEHPAVAQALAEAQTRLGEFGRLVVRPSGTEPLIRIMAQGPEQHLVEELIASVSAAVQQAEAEMDAAQA
ncbi:MAG: phosphoglucosamine mutase [Syntrophomonadaceae bacterium]|nr:phosphoglucosamine mutase [Syntrophomonadaceae bacterium]